MDIGTIVSYHYPPITLQPGVSMRQGFTLIELMIVIAIIAIIAAIAIPNLLESRITANESAAAASLKSGFHAGQTQFQSGAYSDVDSDGRGEYATNHQYMAGSVTTNTSGEKGATTRPLTLIAPTYTVNDGQPVGPYRYQIDTDTTAFAANGTDESGSASNGESFWAGYAVPSTPNADGRRSFAINVAGVVFATKQTVATDVHVLTTIAPATGTFMFAASPITNNPTVNPTYAVPYQK